MEWWTHLWLNEGFASFMENLTTDLLYPQYHIWDQFVPRTLIEALKLDALSSSHPIEVRQGCISVSHWVALLMQPEIIIYLICFVDLRK
jgi:aminopeptidase N